MCLARGIYFSRNTAELPNARSASPCASSSNDASSDSFFTTRMPRPPPPKAALMINGNPISFASFNAWARSLTGSSVPGRTGTLIRIATARAAVLSPIMSSSSGRGPTKVMPSRAQARANAGFSLRNP